ncbi:MAG: DUF1311 domain-containing protein [Rhodanobacter sp.]|nr:MAG: DUF1311 domain-containing protein [Rhodanobacter sp.]
MRSTQKQEVECASDQGQAVFNVAGYFEVKTNLPTTPADQLASRLATFSNALNNQSGQQIFKHVVYFKAHAHIIEKLDGSSGLDINQVSSLDRPFGPASRSSQQAQVGSTSIPSVPIAPPSISTAVSEAQLKTPLQAERMSGNLPPSSQLPASVPVQHGPSFDCTRAATLTEKAICASPALSQMDYNIAAEYRTLRNRASRDKSQELLHSQRQWLIERNVRCSGDVNCLMQMLSDRTHELQRIAD